MTEMRLPRWLRWRTQGLRPVASTRHVPARAVLVCSCGTWWDQPAIDEFNGGDVARASQRHLTLHTPVRPDAPRVDHTLTAKVAPGTTRGSAALQDPAPRRFRSQVKDSST